MLILWISIKIVFPKGGFRLKESKGYTFVLGNSFWYDRTQHIYGSKWYITDIKGSLRAEELNIFTEKANLLERQGRKATDLMRAPGSR